MSTANGRANGGRVRAAAWAGGAIIVIVGAVLLTRSEGLGAPRTDVPTFATQRGPLTISVTESGTIKSQDQIILKNEVEGQVTLIYLIPEGTRVTKGELLAELDGSQLQDNRVEQRIRVDNAEAEFIRARENLGVVRNQAAADTAQAELDYEFAKEDVLKYRDGEYPQQRREAESKITIAAEELKRATEKLNWSMRLFEEKYISQTELDADRLTHGRAKLEHELAVEALALLEKYTNRRQLAQLQSDVEQTRLALDRAKLKASSDIVQAEAALKAKQAEFEQQQSKLAKIDEQIAKTRITAPRDGLVVYATSTRTSGGRGGMTQPLEEGQTVRERQELIYLPSTSAMMAELMIHESSLEKVQPGQPVRVTVDALPERLFEGEVRAIAPLPDAQSMFMSPDRKVYATKVFLHGENPELRTGMSCRAEIIVSELSDATYVPSQAVVRLAGRPTVYVRSKDAFLPRTVEVGLDNVSMVHIVSGVSVGEVVSLSPPLDGSTVPRVAASMRTLTSSQPASRPAFAGGPAGSAESRPSEDERAAMRERFANMTPEERAAERRRRMESMTPEEREAFMERMRQRPGGEAGDSGADRGDGERPARSGRDRGERPERAARPRRDGAESPASRPAESEPSP